MSPFEIRARLLCEEDTSTVLSGVGADGVDGTSYMSFPKNNILFDSANRGELTHILPSKAGAVKLAVKLKSDGYSVRTGYHPDQGFFVYYHRPYTASNYSNHKRTTYKERG